MSKKVRIYFSGSHQEVKALRGTTLLGVLQENSYAVAAPCGGHGTCKKCRVEWREEAHPEPDFQEVLACQTLLEKNGTLRMPDPQAASIQSDSYFPDIPVSYSPYPPGACGFSIDIGTTTLVVFLEDLSNHRPIDQVSLLNPQQVYGADVLSRIRHAADPDKRAALTNNLRAALNQAMEQLIHRHSQQIQHIRRVTVAGNVTLLHLFAGIDPATLATYPFRPVFLDEKILHASEVDLQLEAHTPIILLPSLSAFVGADILGGLAATELGDEDGYSLFLDIGTNGEMAVGNKDRLWCCATAAGPAFEGAGISCGQPGVAGAIHRLSAQGFETIGAAPPTGLCGSGLIDVVAHLLDTGQLDPSGYLDAPVHFLPSHSLTLTPQDIREVQLAKGAIAGGIQTLLEEAGLQETDISRVYLAGGFGFAIHPASAIRIGLLPEAFRHKIIRAGNTAGLGARLYLHADAFKHRTQALRERATYFDLSAHENFSESFVMHMPFPDKKSG